MSPGLPTRGRAPRARRYCRLDLAMDRVVPLLAVLASSAAVASPPGDAPTTARASGIAAPADASATASAAPAAEHPGEPSAVPAAPPWPPRELRVGTWDLVATGALAAGVVAVQFGVPQPTQAKWGSTGFDDWVRGGLRLSSESARTAAATTSDVLVYTLVALPFLNAFLVAGVEHERMDVAWKLAAIDAETLLTVTFVTLSVQKITARGRPFVQECVTNPTLTECGIGTSNASFPSAHTSVAFAAVSLECFHHGYLDTSHTGWGDRGLPGDDRPGDDHRRPSHRQRPPLGVRRHRRRDPGRHPGLRDPRVAPRAGRDQDHGPGALDQPILPGPHSGGSVLNAPGTRLGNG